MNDLFGVVIVAKKLDNSCKSLVISPDKKIVDAQQQQVIANELQHANQQIFLPVAAQDDTEYNTNDKTSKMAGIGCLQVAGSGVVAGIAEACYVHKQICETRNAQGHRE